MKLFKSGAVVKIGPIRQMTFQEWCVEGIVTPFYGGNGQGDHRFWTLMQVVGITVAIEARKSYVNYPKAFVKRIVEAIGGMEEEELLKLFKAGKTHFYGTVSAPNGPIPVFDKPVYDFMVDTKAIYERVKAYER